MWLEQLSSSHSPGISIAHKRALKRRLHKTTLIQLLKNKLSDMPFRRAGLKITGVR